MCFLRTRFSFPYIHCHKKMEFKNQFCSLLRVNISKPWETCPHYGVARTRGVLLLDCHFFERLLRYRPRFTAIFSRVILHDQFSSVAQSCATLCDPVNRSTPGFPVHHKLPEFTQTHAHRVRDAIQPSHPLSSPSPPAPSPSQHQSLFQ